jgi:hypothetical protein
MIRSLAGKLFFLSVLVVSGFAVAGARASQDWGCSGSTQETCPTSDIGCHEENVHYYCTWHTEIDHCNCNFRVGGGF